jgi:ribosomal protein L40E
MTCRNCNAPLNDGAKFCNKCGTAVIRDTPPIKTKKIRRFPLAWLTVIGSCLFIAVVYILFFHSSVMQEVERRRLLHNNREMRVHTQEGLITGEFTGWAHVQDGLPTGHGVFTGYLPNGNWIRISSQKWEDGYANGHSSIEIYTKTQPARSLLYLPVLNYESAVAYTRENMNTIDAVFDRLSRISGASSFTMEFIINDFPNLVMTFSGNIIDSLPHGQGSMKAICPLGTIQFYNGMFTNSLPHGQGLLHELCSFGTTQFYEGMFANGEKSGNGFLTITCQFDSYQQYEGMFLNGQRHGYGTLINICPLGTVQQFEGQFENDNRHGEGILTLSARYSSFLTDFDANLLQDSLTRWHNIHQQTNTRDEITMQRWVTVFNNISDYLARVYNVRYIDNRLDDASVTGFTFKDTNVRFVGYFNGTTPFRGRLIFGNTPLSYEGMVNAHGQPHGQGIVTGCMLNYEGWLAYGAPQGTGTLTFPSGHTVRGNWNGLVFEDNRRYARQFLNAAIFDGPILPRNRDETVRGRFIPNTGNSYLANVTYEGTSGGTSTWYFTETR